ncbi:MAG: DMT family transporter [Synergistaceae bacterium]
MTTSGLLIIGFTPGMEFNFGDPLSFFMAVFYAFLVLGSSYCSRKVEPIRLVALHIILLASVTTLLASIFEPTPDLLSFSPKIWATLLCVSLGNTTLCFILQFKAQKVTPETHAAIISSLEGLFGYIGSVISGQAPFHLQGALGGLIVIAGMLLHRRMGFCAKSAPDFFIKKDVIYRSSYKTNLCQLYRRKTLQIRNLFLASHKSAVLQNLLFMFGIYDFTVTGGIIHLPLYMAMLCREDCFL